MVNKKQSIFHTDNKNNDNAYNGINNTLNAI